MLRRRTGHLGRTASGLPPLLHPGPLGEPHRDPGGYGVSACGASDGPAMLGTSAGSDSPAPQLHGKRYDPGACPRPARERCRAPRRARRLRWGRNRVSPRDSACGENAPGQAPDPSALQRTPLTGCRRGCQRHDRLRRFRLGSARRQHVHHGAVGVLKAGRCQWLIRSSCMARLPRVVITRV
jgi:hypothetical protein